MRQITVSADESNQRLDKLLSRYLNEAPKSFIYKMLRKKNITLNGKKADGSEKTAVGDEVIFWLSDDTFDKFSAKPEDLRLPLVKGKDHRVNVIYEDDHIIIMNKPAGILSQKAEPNDVSVNEEMLAHLLSEKKITPESLAHFKPSVVNRLDRNTSGLIAGGISLCGTQLMSACFKERTIHKYYYCLVEGCISEPVHLTGYLVKDAHTNKVSISSSGENHGDYIETEYVPAANNGQYTLLKVFLITGRTHQIRAHLAFDHHPVIGDVKYGDAAVNMRFKQRYGVRHQLLHAAVLQMPAFDGDFAYLSGKQFFAPLPDEFARTLRAEGLPVPEGGS